MEGSTSPLTPPRVIPPGKPLGGVRFLAAFVRNPLEVLPRAAYEEDFIAFGSGRLARAWVTSPAIIRAVLLEQRDKFAKLTQIRLLGPLLGKGILTSEGADWKWQRQAAAPMFRPQELAGFVPAFVRAAQDTVARWRADAGEPVREIEHDMTRTTFDVIAATLLPSASESLALDVQRSVRALQRHGTWGLLYASLNLPRWLPRPGMLAGVRAVNDLRAAVARLIVERRAGGAAHDDLMTRLIAARDPESGRAMDQSRLIDNLLTFYLAGHETTAKALTWALYLVARSPQWSAALEEEIDRVTGGASISAEHIDKLVLVQQVIKESIRLYPPVPMMSRQAIADTTLEGHAIRAGTSILIPIYAVHRHAKRWERPDEFDPARFSRDNEAAIPRYQYMPFGAGPRVCIGMSFAMMEATAILATFMQRVRFEAVAGHEPTPVASVTLIPKGGMPLRVSLRPG
jgi:cytochrome P450